MFKAKDKVKLNLNKIILQLRNISKKDRKRYLRVHILPYVDKVGTVIYANSFGGVVTRWSNGERLYHQENLIKV